MSPDPAEPAPPLQPEDMSLEAQLATLPLRPPHPDFLDRLLYHLELTACDELAASAPDSPPMPLDATLLAFESELRALKPLEIDFPTGQRVLQAIASEMAPAAPAFSIVPPAAGTSPAAAAPAPAASQRRRWSPAAPWAAAAALVAASWLAFPHLPRNPGATTAHHSFIPYAADPGNRASVDIVYPVNPGVRYFGPHPGLQTVDTNSERASVIAIPEARARYAFLGVDTFDVSPEDLQKFKLPYGVGISRLEPGGPAATQGLEPGDVILRLNGAPVPSADDFAAMVKNSAPGSTLTLTLFRRNIIGNLTVRLGSAPST